MARNRKATAAFPLRIPPLYRQVAYGLTQVRLSDPESPYRVKESRSVNDALIRLLRAGIEQEARIARDDLIRTRTEMARWERVLSRFLENRDLHSVASEDFPEIADWIRSVSSSDPDVLVQPLFRSDAAAGYAEAANREAGLRVLVETMERALTEGGDGDEVAQ